MRIALGVRYNGQAYQGWQSQRSGLTVQDRLEAALTRFADRPVATLCAGRTDAGVHARGQVVHCDVPEPALRRTAGRSTDPPLTALTRRLNGILPAEVRIRRTTQAADGFDARFSALSRRYVYRIADDPVAVDPLRRHEVLAWPRALDVTAMAEASRDLTGEHDFAAFCRRREGGTTIRTLLGLDWARDGGRIDATVRADAFCHSMVRALVGCLLAVGEGRRPWHWPRDVLAVGAKNPAVTVAPAHGLTLEEVVYPADRDLAARAAEARTRRA